MRGLTTRTVRPCLQSSSQPSTIPFLRSATSPPLQRAFTSADAFLFFLPSVLTAALVIDYNGKERRRSEWDHQITLAQEEADRLRHRQLEAWSRLQRRSVGNGAWQQRRNLYTASQTIQELDDDTERMMDPLGRKDEINTADQKARSDVELGEDVSTEDNVKKQERFGRLLATKLALEMMLRLRMGRTSRYKAQPTVNVDSRVYHQSMDYILQELEKVVDLIRSLEIKKVPWDVKMPDEFHQKQANMAREVSELVDKYRNVEMHLPDFVMSFVQLVADYKIGLPNQSYVEIMRALSFHQSESTMARHVEDTLLDSHQRLDCYAISNILYHHGIMADSLRFTQFLERLTRADQHPRPVSPWYRIHVNDIDICIPITKDGHVITALARSALQCRQATVAEAYALVFMDRDRIEKYSGIHKWFMLSNFLQSYGNWMSWESGRKWLRLAITWMSELATSEEHVLGRVVLRMLDFCVACGKHDDYEAIMRAVVAANMLLPELTPGATVKISARMAAIRRDWMSRIQNMSQHNRLRPPRQEQAEIFASTLDGRWELNSKASERTGPQTDASWKEPGYLAYNPLTAAERLDQVSEQRQQTFNHGFKSFVNHDSNPQRTAFPPSGEQNALSNEPVDDDTTATLESEEFVSPFFQPVQQETTKSPAHTQPRSMDSTRSTSGSILPNRSSDDRIQVLIKAFKRAEARLLKAQSIANKRAQELEEIREHLESTRSISGKVSPATRSVVNDDDEAVIRSSASG